jgi:hypothetical protein
LAAFPFSGVLLRKAIPAIVILNELENLVAKEALSLRHVLKDRSVLSLLQSTGLSRDREEGYWAEH